LLVGRSGKGQKGEYRFLSSVSLCVDHWLSRKENTMPAQANLLIQREMDITVVDLQDSRILDILHVESIGEQLFKLVDQMDRKKLIVDCSKVQHMGSAAIGMILTLNAKSKAIKGALVLCGVRPDVMKIFSLMKLNKVLKFAPNLNDARVKLGKN